MYGSTASVARWYRRFQEIVKYGFSVVLDDTMSMPHFIQIRPADKLDHADTHDQPYKRLFRAHRARNASNAIS